jgi:hypothetical protein
VIIDVDGPAAHISYFQDSDEDTPQYEEDLPASSAAIR